jgi:hypothetical protein
MYKRFAGCLAMTVLAAGLWSCSEVVPTTTHAAISPDQVKIYKYPPAKYEKQGPIRHVVTSTEQWREDADATAAFNDIFAQAAAKGANGLLLTDETGASTDMVGARVRGQYYLVPIQRSTKTVIVTSIYVVKE